MTSFVVVIDFRHNLYAMKVIFHTISNRFLFRHVGEFFGNAPTVCGGRDALASVDQKYCFQWVFGLNGLVDRWDVLEDRLSVPRVSPAGVVVRHWAISGQRIWQQ